MKKLLIFLPLILCILIGCQDKYAKKELENFKAQKKLEVYNKSVVQRYWDGKWNERRPEILDELQTKNVVYQGFETLNGVEEYKQAYSGFLSAFHDTRLVVEELIAEGDLVLSRVMLHGIHKGEFKGIPPTGNEISISLFTVFHLEDGKIAQEWEIFDQFRLMMQLGMELKMKAESE